MTSVIAYLRRDPRLFVGLAGLTAAFFAGQLLRLVMP